MLWPIGQPFGELRELAKQSVAIWLEVLEASGLWHERNGSLHLAYHADEAQILDEFAKQSREMVSTWNSSIPPRFVAVLRLSDKKGCEEAVEFEGGLCRSPRGRRRFTGLVV